MDLLQGVLLTGAAATGLVVAERVRHRGSGTDVREDVTQFGTTVAERVGQAAGWVGHAGSWAFGETAKFADGMGDRTADVVTGAGRTVARGAGATMGAYAGAIDRVVPRFGRGDDSEPTTAAKAPSTKASAGKRTAKTSSAKRPTAAKAS